MERKLEVIPAMTDAVAIGMKNAASLVLAVLLWVITIWIPYLNVGTTIAMYTIPGKLAKGEVINPAFIFDSIYRKKIGDFFLLNGFLFMMYVPAFFFMVIPFYVLSIMYSLAFYIMIDKDVSPSEALRLSNNATYGFKWKIFGINLLFVIASWIVIGIIMTIVGALDVAFITFIFMIALIVLVASCAFALSAVIYRNLFLAVQPEAAAAADEGIVL